MNIIKHPSVILIVGRRDSGKSALGFKIPEYLRWNGETYVVGPPQKARRLLPEWIAEFRIKYKRSQAKGKRFLPPVQLYASMILKNCHHNRDTITCHTIFREVKSRDSKFYKKRPL